MKVRIRGPHGSSTIEATVDTGATNTTIQKEVAERLGIKVTDCQEVILANGRPDTLGVGSAEIEIDGTARAVPIFIYESNLVGLTTLEASGLG